MVSDGLVDGLIGRSLEISTLEELASAVQAGRGTAIVVRGEADIGKSALIGRLVESAPNLQNGAGSWRRVGDGVGFRRA
jgi:hypothetical protein